MASPFVQKLIWTALAVGVYALTAVPGMAGVAEPLKVLAGLIVGAAWVARPGDAKAAIMLLALCTLPMLHACAWWQETGKPIVRTVVEVARHLCLLTAEEQDRAALDGMTPADFCAAEENLRPFIDEVLAAKQRASGKAGLATSGGESP